ncbi:MAG: DNA repair protein RecO [Candidatus Sericytochromatia bacterium]|nr:DNA repair protein RecO [Candidatus Sericytochromatia bacterium]
MSESYAAQGVNIRHHALGEADRIISVFTREHGIVRAVAKGVKKPTSRLGGRMELLHCNTLMFRRGRSLDIILTAETVRSFGGLRLDFDRLAFALYLAEVVNGLLPVGHPQPVVYDLFVSTLAMLETLERPELVALWFQLQLLTELGHHVGLTACHGCQRPIEPQRHGVGFQLSLGAIVCPDCRFGRPDVRELMPAALTLLRQLRHGGIQALVDITEPVTVALGAQRVLGDYFATLAEREIKSLRILLDQAAV